jgi:hypothetical protein
MLDKFKDDILQLDVYPCPPEKRQAAMDFWVDATVLAPQHIYFHCDHRGQVTYEIAHPFIQRAGMQPGETVPFDSSSRIHSVASQKSFDYIAVGDCTTLTGLAAPYDEEDTTHIWKLEHVPDDTTLLDFWLKYANQDLFGPINPEMQDFEK